MSRRYGFLNLLVLMAALAGCNGHDPGRRDSDPLKDYPELKTYIPPSQVPAPAAPAATPEPPRQQVFKSQLFDVRTDQESQAAIVLQFVAGERSRHVLKLRTFVDRVDATLKAHDLPPGARLTEAPDQKGTWILDWAPSFDLVGPRLSVWEGRFQLEYVLTNKTPAAEAALFKGEERLIPVMILVRRTSQQPIISVNFPKGSLNETQAVPFTVDVIDPVGGTKRAPDVFVTWEPETLTAEKKLFPGHQGVVRDPQNLKPKAQPNGSWRFFYVFKPWIVAEEARKAGHKEEVHAEFVIIANSAISDHSSTSPTQALHIKMNQGSPK